MQIVYLGGKEGQLEDGSEIRKGRQTIKGCDNKSPGTGYGQNTHNRHLSLSSGGWKSGIRVPA